MSVSKTLSVGDIIGIRNQVSDRSILTGLWISCVVGVAVIITFCVLQRRSLLYQYRLVSECVRVKPPKLRKHGFKSYIDWAIQATIISDVEFIQSAGLDALVMVKLCALGVQMFLPPCLIGIVVLIPLHWTGGVSQTTTLYHSGFMRLTMSNIEQGSPVFWVHLVCVYVYIGWAMLLLRWHYHQYLTIRQYYLRKGEDMNVWRALYEHETQPQGPPAGNLRAFLRSVPLFKALLPSGVPVIPDSAQVAVQPVKDSDDEDDLPAMTSPSKMYGQSGIMGSPPSAGDVLRKLHHPDSVARWRGSRMASMATRGPSQPERNSMPSAVEAAGVADGHGDQAAGTNNHRDWMGGSLHTAGSRTMLRGGSAAQGLLHDVRSVQRGGSRTYAPRPSTGLPPRESIEEGLADSMKRRKGDDHEAQPAEPSTGDALQAAGKVAGNGFSAGAARGDGAGPSAAKGNGGPVAEATGDPPRADGTDPDPAALKSTMLAPGHNSREPDGPSDVSAMVPLEEDKSVFAASDVQLCIPSVDSAGMGGGSNDSTALHPGANELVPSFMDIEAGHVPDDSSSNRTMDAPPDCPAMERPDWINPESHLLEWWLDPRKVPKGEQGRHRAQQGAGDDAKDAADGSSQGTSDDQTVVSRSRPSVSHRKTVNATHWDGSRTAVLAQHYAVLVTDVIEREQPGQEDAKQATNPVEATKVTKRLASFLPICLRRWCNMRYGNQAARKLNMGPVSRTSSDGSYAGSLYPPQTLSTPKRSATRAFYAHLAHQGSADAVSRMPNGAAPAPGHRRTRSTGDALRPVGSRGGPLGADPDLGAGGLQGSQAARAGSGGQGFSRLLDMMAEHAMDAQDSTTRLDKGEVPAGSADSGSVGGAAAALARPASASMLAPQHQRKPSVSRLGGVDASGVNGGGDAGSARPSTRLGSLSPGALPPLPPRPLGAPAGSAPSGSGPGPVAEAAELTEGGSDHGTGAGLSVTPEEPAGALIRISPSAPAGADGGSSGRDGAEQEFPSSRAAWYWAVARAAVMDGRVAMLPRRSRYSVVSSTFARLFPGEFDRAIPVINHKEVDMLLLQIDQHMAGYEYATLYEEQTKKELFGRIGCCGLRGERKRLREYHRHQVNELLSQVPDVRRRAFEQAHTPSWFVFFRTQRAAAMAAQCVIHAEDNRQFRVHPAPGPEEVNWSALWSDFRSRDLRRNLMRPVVILVVAFPIGIFTGGLMQLDYLLCPRHLCDTLQRESTEWVNAGCSVHAVARERHQLSFPWYCGQQNFMARVIKTLVVGWVPSLLITLWQGMILPLVFTLVVQVSRQARSLSNADRAIAKNMFYFGVFNVFIGGVVGSTIIQGINSAIEKGPGEIFNLIGTYLPTSSNYFINYTMFRALVSTPLRMLWPHIGIRMYLVRRYLRLSSVITKRERAFLMAPVSPRYGFEVGMVLLIYVIAFAYSVVSPVLLIMAMVFFSMHWLFWRWALLYVYVRKYEGGGTMWPLIFSRVMVCICIFPAFTACVFVTKHAYAQALLLLVTVPVIVIRFNRFCYYRFQSGINALPLEATVSAPTARVEPWVYTPPPLLPNLAGWNPDWSKTWQGWNMPVVYG